MNPPTLKALAAVLLLLSVAFSLAGIDLIVTGTLPGQGGGGGSRVSLPANICTNSTIGSSGCVVPALNVGNLVTSTVSTTSGSYVSTGEGFRLTTLTTNRVKFSGAIIGSGNVVSSDVEFRLFTTTGAIPALGVAATGSIFDGYRVAGIPANNQTVIVITVLWTGATLNVSSNYYIGFRTIVTGETLTLLGGTHVTALEI